MSFVPQTTQYVAYVNYQQSYSTSGNPALFGGRSVLQFYQLSLDIALQSVVFELAIQLPPSSFNSAAVTGSVIKIRNDTMRIFTNALGRTNLTKIIYDGYPIYQLLLTTPERKLVNANTAILDDSTLVVSLDQSSGRFAVETILDQYVSKIRGLFDKEDVRQGIYVSSSSNSYIGLFVGTFSNEFNNSRLIVKSIVAEGDNIRVTRSVLFPSSENAMDALGHAHQVYRNAEKYQVVDRWLVVTYKYGLSKLNSEIIGI